MLLRCACMLALLVAAVLGDVYLHSPRGSNNRLNEQSAERTNANRIFDSQNNNRGGYNAGDVGENAANNENQQYRMQYFQSSNYKVYQEDGLPTGEGQSYLTLEWTNQHGCGGTEDTDPHKMNCNVVVQYMCQDEGDSNSGDDIRNGQTTDTQNYNQLNNLQEDANTASNREKNSVQPNRGLHEPFQFYDNCYARERNQGLFTADQNLQQTNNLGYSSAINTRQNPNGNRRGYECPEERDYYPYWHGSPWKDIAIMVGNLSQCQYYQTESFNVQPKYECVEYFNANKLRPYSRWNNQADCEENGGDWTGFYNYLEIAAPTNQADCENENGVDGFQYIWGFPYREVTEKCLVALDAPECMEAPWSRDNHLGNTRGGQPSRFTWTIPKFPSNTEKRCAMRIRYNISTDDYDPMNTNASQNQNIETGQMSPVQQNPYVDIGADNVPLRLAINTAQFGRTFQDRSHAFLLLPRPDAAGLDKKQIFNINVRGKRGNIVQVYPAVEYDFIPNDLEITEGSLVHMQWTGSNTHNNGNPGGDGQTGDAGEGREGTDRSNIVQTPNAIGNYPLPFEESTLFTNARIHWSMDNNYGPEDLAIRMASAGYYLCKEAETCGAQSVQNKNQLNNLLDNAPASHPGALIEPVAGEYHYMCSRNNNFTNRSQKGKLVVKKK